MKCKLVPMSPAAWKTYEAWNLARGLQPAPPNGPGGWVFVAFAGEQGIHLLSGAWIGFGADHALLEGFLAAPGLPGRLLRACAVATIGTAVSASTALGKQLRALPRSRSQVSLLLQQGFQVAGPALPGVMFHEPGFEFEVPTKPKRRSPAVAQTREAPAGATQKTPVRRIVRPAAAKRKR